MQLTKDQIITEYSKGFDKVCKDIDVDPIELMNKQSQDWLSNPKAWGNDARNPMAYNLFGNKLRNKIPSAWQGFSAADIKGFGKGSGVKLSKLLSGISKMSNPKKIAAGLVALFAGGVGLNYLGAKGSKSDPRLGTSAGLAALLGAGGAAGGYAYNKYYGDKDEEKEKSPLLPMLAGGVGGAAIGAGLPFLGSKSAEMDKEGFVFSATTLAVLGALASAGFVGSAGLDVYAQIKRRGELEAYRKRLHSGIGGGGGIGAALGAIGGGAYGALMPGKKEDIDPKTGKPKNHNKRIRRAMIGTLIGTGVGGGIGAGVGALGTHFTEPKTAAFNPIKSIKDSLVKNVGKEITDKILDNARNYGALGTGIGAVGGGLIGGLMPESDIDPKTGKPRKSRLSRILKGLLIGGGAGGLIGGVGGALGTRIGEPEAQASDRTKPYFRDLDKPYSELSPLGSLGKATVDAYNDSGLYDSLMKKPNWGNPLAIDPLSTALSHNPIAGGAYKAYKGLTTPWNEQLKDLRQSGSYLNPMNYIRGINQHAWKGMGPIEKSKSQNTIDTEAFKNRYPGASLAELSRRLEELKKLRANR
ncbi:hypothetical protein ACFLQL_02260 [Verrucomicrobiota bacterium]